MLTAGNKKSRHYIVTNLSDRIHMYGMFTYIYHQFMPNIGKIHGKETIFSESMPLSQATLERNSRFDMTRRAATCDQEKWWQCQQEIFGKHMGIIQNIFDKG